MAIDFYAEARRLITMIQREGMSDWAAKIQSAFDEGVTATEILMMLRWGIGEYLAAGVGTSNTTEFAKDLYHKIDSVVS
jgi:hypothetical protein